MAYQWLIFFLEGLVCGLYWSTGVVLDLDGLICKKVLGSTYVRLLSCPGVFTEEEIYDMMLFVATTAHFSFVLMGGSLMVIIGNWGFGVVVIGYIMGLLMFMSYVNPQQVFGQEPDAVITKMLLRKADVKCPRCRRGFNKHSVVENVGGNVQHIWC